MSKGQPLTCFLAGSNVVVRKICTTIADSRKLMIFGLIIGTNVKILQSRPVMVLQVDYTEFAVDRAIAAFVWAEATK
jgi:Fe2+ transport system protein FeoA